MVSKDPPFTAEPHAAPPITDWTSDYPQRQFLAEQRADAVRRPGEGRYVGFRELAAEYKRAQTLRRPLTGRRSAHASVRKPRTRQSHRLTAGHRRTTRTSASESPSGEPEPPRAASPSRCPACGSRLIRGICPLASCTRRAS